MPGGHPTLGREASQWQDFWTSDPGRPFRRANAACDPTEEDVSPAPTCPSPPSVIDARPGEVMGRIMRPPQRGVDKYFENGVRGLNRQHNWR
jgi:hypothetical protein